MRHNCDSAPVHVECDDRLDVFVEKRMGVLNGFAKASFISLLLLMVTKEGTVHAQTGALNSRALPDSLRHGTAMVNGVRLHYVTGGKGPGPVLIHGLPTTWYEWRGILPALAERYQVIAPDLRGLGDSSKPPGGYDTHTAAEDIHQLVRSMGIDQVYVAGHDWGAAVGFAYAVRYPQEVRRLAILDMLIPGFGAEDGFRVTRQGGPWHTIFHMVPHVPEALITGRERQYLSMMYSGLYGTGDDPTAINEQEIDEYVRVYTKPGALRAYLSYYRSLSARRPKQELAYTTWFVYRPQRKYIEKLIRKSRLIVDSPCRVVDGNGIRRKDQHAVDMRISHIRQFAIALLAGRGRTENIRVHAQPEGIRYG